MSQFDDDYEGSDGSEDTDPMIRELRTEILRLEAQLDQLSASVRERAEESALIQAKLAVLELRIARLEAGRRQDARIVRLTWWFVSSSLGLWFYYAYATFFAK